MAEQSPSLLSWKKDRYGGVIVEHVPFTDGKEFENVLTLSLKEWFEAGVRGVWIHLLPLQHAQLFPILLSNGFSFHHADEREAVLTRWLPQDLPSSLPSDTTHHIGAGGLVFHPEDCYKLLVVSEKVETKIRFKIPGGLVDQKESIAAGAVREVREETGVVCDVASARMLVMRDRQDAHFGKSDLYCVLILEALSVQLTPCEREISFCEWMDVRQVLDNPSVYPFNRSLFTCALEIAKEKERQKKEGKNEQEARPPPTLKRGTFPAFWNPGSVHDLFVSDELFLSIFERHQNSKF